MSDTTRLVLLTARAIATGVIVTLLFRFLVAIPLVSAGRAVGSGQWLGQWLLAGVLPAMMPALAAALAGWAVARFHRERQVRMVVSYCVFVIVLTSPRLYALVTNAIADTRFLAALMNYVLHIFVVAGGVLIGGLWLAGPAVASPRGIDMSVGSSTVNQ